MRACSFGFWLAAGASAALALGGCRPAAPRAGAAVPAPPARPAAAQSCPEYREAARRYARGDRAGALALIDRALARPRCTAAGRAFLARQREICLGGGSRFQVQGSKFKVPGSRLGVGAAGTKGAPSEDRPPRPLSTDHRPLTTDCGPKALLAVSEKLGVRVTLAELSRAAGVTRRGTTLEGLARAARAQGLKAEGVQMDEKALSRLHTPAIAWVDGDHYLAVWR